MINFQDTILLVTRTISKGTFFLSPERRNAIEDNAFSLRNLPPRHTCSSHHRKKVYRHEKRVTIKFSLIPPSSVPPRPTPPRVRRNIETPPLVPRRSRRISSLLLLLLLLSWSLLLLFLLLSLLLL